MSGLQPLSRETARESSVMLQELSHMDRITQLQDEIQQVSQWFYTLSFYYCRAYRQTNMLQRLTIMSNSIAYLTSKANFVQVSPDVPITKQRNPEKVDPPDVFEGKYALSRSVYNPC